MKKIWKIILAVFSLLVKDSRGENPTESEIWLNEETNKPVGTSVNILVKISSRRFSVHCIEFQLLLFKKYQSFR